MAAGGFTALIKGFKARIAASRQSNGNRNRRFHGAVPETVNLTGVESAVLARSREGVPLTTHREGSRLYVNVDSLEPIQIRDVIAQLRVEGIQNIETDVDGSSPNNSFERGHAGAPVQTIQETSTKFKLHTLISVSIFCVGAIWSYAALSSVDDPSVSPIANFLFVIGLVWFVVTRFRIWWHHK